MTEALCQGCLQRDAALTLLQQQVQQMQQRIRDLEQTVRALQDRLNTNSTNSSLPPSADPPQAPKPPPKTPSGKKPGGQPGHPAHLRRLLPPDRVNHVVAYVPTHCRACQASLPQHAQPGDPAPQLHQQVELPPLVADVTEHQGHARRCPCCGEITWGQIPADVRQHVVGPRLTAFLAYLAGSMQASKRSLEALAEDALGVPLALGTVANLHVQAAAALQASHQQVVAAVREAPTKGVDETGWKLKGKLRWLWVATTTTLAAFVVGVRRGVEGLKNLLGEEMAGLVTSDRWAAYDEIPLGRRQLCWAHLKRDFQKCLDRGGDGAFVGSDGLALVRRVFETWHAFRGGGFDRAELGRRMGPIRAEVRDLLERGCVCACAATLAFCANILLREEALWLFVRADGVEPTNNQAERVLRRGVLWRKRSFGSWSEEGCRFVERLLTVVGTLRLQGRSVMNYLYEAVVAHRANLPAPNLLTV